jgi:hypothetical protein
MVRCRTARTWQNAGREGEAMRKICCVVLLISVWSSGLGAQEYVPLNARVFVEVSEPADEPTTEPSDKRPVDFSAALIAGLNKKKVPVVVVMDPEKADYVIRHTSSSKEDSTGMKVTKLFFGRSDFTKFEGSIMVVNKESTAVVFSYNVKKSNFQSAAEAFAKHFGNHIRDGAKKGTGGS